MTTRVFFASALVMSLAAALAAQDQPPGGKDKKVPGDKAKDVVARVARDMQTAEERLKKSDPGDVTRKVQRDIVDGLDELIKQNTKSPDDSSGGGKSSKMKSANSQRQSSNQNNAKASNQPQDQQVGPKSDSGNDDRDQPGKAKGGKDEDAQAKAKGEGDNKEDKQGSAKAGGKDDGKDEKGQAKANDPGKEPGQQGALASVKNDPLRAKTDLTADTYRADWGHLPLTKRLEMDAYSKERFMPRYDEVLQQYYRTIAEQGQKKDK